jgi:hypothetical protein
LKRSHLVTLIAGGALAAGVMAYAENRRCQPGPDGQPASCTSSGSGSSGYHGSGGGGSSSAAATTRGGFGSSGSAHGFFGG